MINKGMVRINDELFIIKLILDEKYEPLGSNWNALLPLNKTFKKDGKIFFCELIEEVETIEENVENLID
jgi:hypothetical protein